MQGDYLLLYTAALVIIFGMVVRGDFLDFVKLSKMGKTQLQFLAKNGMKIQNHEWYFLALKKFC